MSSNLPTKGEDVEVYHMKLWYDAVLLKARPTKAYRGPTTPGPHFEAFVHFQGWSKRQDSWVHCSRVRPRMIGTDPSGADWIRNSVNKASIKPGLLIEVRMVPQWLPAEILGPDAAGEPGSFRARLGTDGTELNVTPDEIIKRWPIPVKPGEAAIVPAAAPATRDAATVGQRLRMKYIAEGVAEWFGGKVQTVQSGGKTFDIAFDDGSFETGVSIEDPDLIMEWPEDTSTAATVAEPTQSAVDEVVPAQTTEKRKGKKRKNESTAEKSSKKQVATAAQDRFCICKSRAVPERRWIGCCQCREWYHPECLGITYQTPPQWVCPACQGNSKSASETGVAQAADVPDESGVIIRRAFEKVVANVDSDLGEGDRYCICRRSYSAATAAAGPQNFLQCEFCAEWFHFECLGVSDEDVEKIDRFMCPRCSSMAAVLQGSSATVVSQGNEKLPQLTDHEYYISCTAHVSDAAAFDATEVCLLCSATGPASAFIFCTQCGESFHKTCLSPSLDSRKKYDRIAARWRCLSCMRCSTCETEGDDNLMVCDVCDRGFHLACIRPKLERVPDGTWLCEDCVQCLCCGSTSPGKNKTDVWHEDYSLCTPCWRLYQKKQFCPACHKVWDVSTQERMVECDKCGMWVHTACDNIDDDSYKRLALAGASYFCFQCRDGKGSKRKDIQDFKKSMRFLRKKAKRKPKSKDKEPGQEHVQAPTQPEDPVPEAADTGTDPPAVSAGSIDEPAISRMKMIRGTQNLPTQTELRSWTHARQTEFWYLRRRFWEKEKLRGCQKACKAKRLWDGGSKTQMVTRLVQSEFFAGLRPHDYLDYDPNAADIVIPVPVVTTSQQTNTQSAHASSFYTAGAASGGAAASVGTVSAPSASERAVASSESTHSRPESEPPSSNFSVSVAPRNLTAFSGNGTFDESDTKSLSTLQALLEMSQPGVSANISYTAAPSLGNPENAVEASRGSPSPAPDSTPLVESSATDNIQFHVQMLDRKPIKVKAALTTTILVLKQALQEKCGVVTNKQRVLYAGVSLEDGETLSSCNVKDDATMSLDTVLSDSESDDAFTSSDDEVDESGSEEEVDQRCCALCHVCGDLKDQGRLLPAGDDTWVHTNCALWSSETYENEDGCLHEVHRALSRGKTITCQHCGESGATVGCCNTSCTASFHFKCAVRLRCLMLTDKQLFCPKHKRKAKYTSKEMHTSRKRRNFVARRKIYLPKVPHVPKKTTWTSSAVIVDGVVGRLIGSFALVRPGTVVFDCPAFHTEQSIYTADYCAIRRFWSTAHANERCPWRLEIARGRGGQYPVFKATCISTGSSFFGISPDAVWVQVLAAVADVHSGRGTGRSISAEDFFGLTKGSVRNIVERLQDAGGCRAYRFLTISRSHAHTPRVNDSGCARTEASTKIYGSAESKAGLGGGGRKSSGPALAKNAASTVQSELENDKQTNHSPHRSGNSGAGTVNMLPDSMQYRQMKATYHQRTSVRNSPIHSLGLFATDGFAAQEMVIEYTGEIIRQKLADKREHMYLQKGIACYLFALDGELVIDSSMKGNSARFINHCCDPNCTARVMNLEGSRRIIFSTLREIGEGEELTYDYKFSAESDPALKVPCSCGAVSCRGWLN